MDKTVGDRPWTRADDNILGELSASGNHARAIAAELSRSESAVRKRAAKIGIKIPVRPPNTWTPEEEDQLKKLARQGFSHGEIAEQIGRSKSSVRNQAAKLQIAIARERNPMRSRPG